MNKYHYELYVKNKANGAVAKFAEKVVEDKSYKNVFDTVIIDHYRSDNVILDEFDRKHYFEVFVWQIDKESGAPIDKRGKLYINNTSFKFKGE